MHVADSKNNLYLKGFVIAWLVVIIVQSLLLRFYFDIDLTASIADSVVFNVTFAFAGYLLWFVVRYNLKEKSSLIDKVSQHLITAVIMVAAWFAISHYTMKGLFPHNEKYLDFLDGSIALRIITGFFYYVVYVLIYYLIIYYEDLQEKLKRETELQNLVKEAELDALKSQINPHFLFNSLNSISSLTITAPDKAQDMIIKLSDFLRYSLSGDRKSMTTLKHEFENINRYLDIEKVRFGDRLHFVSKVDEDCYEVRVPSLILQPLIENAIKHGVYNSSEGVQIQFECIKENGFILIRITNDFDKKSVKKKGEGIGLKNIKNRLKLIYQRQDLLKTYEKGDVFVAELKIPEMIIN